MKARMRFIGKAGEEVSPVFEQYWAAQLAAGGGTYTVAASGFYQGGGEVMGSIDVMAQQGYTGTWGDAFAKAMTIIMSSGTDVRIKNIDPANAQFGVLMRAIVQHSSPTIELYDSGATVQSTWYTPAVSGLFSVNIFQADEDDTNWLAGSAAYHDGTDWREITESAGVLPNTNIGVADKFRYTDHNGNNRKSIMRWY